MSTRARVSRLVRAAGLDRLARLTWRGLLVLNYHRIGEPTDTDDPDLFSGTVDDLDQHLALLADRVEIVPAGAADLDLRRPARRVAITFDDGYADQLQAAEVLRARDVVGSFFICTGFVDRPRPAWWDEIAWLVRRIESDLPASRWMPDGLPVVNRPSAQVRRSVNSAYKLRVGRDGEEFLDWLADRAGCPRMSEVETRRRWMTWDDVRGLRAAGMEVGGHSVTHPVLANLDRGRQWEEIDTSLARLREALGEHVDTFAYPVGAPGSFDETTHAVLRETGVRRAFSFCGGVNRPRRHQPFDVLRVGVFGGHTPDMVAVVTALPQLLGGPR